MNPRTWARRTKEEALKISNRKGYLQGLGITSEVAYASSLVKDFFACRALCLACPHVGPRPQFSIQPFLQPSNRPEVWQRLAPQRALNRATADLRVLFNGSQGRSSRLHQCIAETLRELLAVVCADRSVVAKVSVRPVACAQVCAWGSVSGRTWHGLTLEGLGDFRIVIDCYYSCVRGSYRSHRSGVEACQRIASSEVTS